MQRFIAILAVLLFARVSQAVVLYDQPHDGSGTLYQSSWWDPDDSDWDIHVWDDFILPTSQAITEVRWRGGYMNGGSYTPTVAFFTVAVYANSIANEPDVVNPPLVRYFTPGNANQTFAGNFGGVAMYDYSFTLPSAFQATGGTKYWIYILAAQHGVPEWGIAKGVGGNGGHFRFVRGIHMYQSISGDTAFTLMGSAQQTYTINASVSPAGAGSVQGAGQYPSGSNCTLIASANVGWGFQRWTENGSQVSANPSYTFIVNANRTLVANFVQAYTVSTSSSPSYGGTTSGGGTFNSGTNATVHATPASGYQFVNWTEFGNPVSASPDYTFAVLGNRTLQANFTLAAGAVMFDFENAPIHTSLPVDLTVSNLSAHFSATGQGFSIQPANTMGFTPPGFSGLCIFPNGVFPADLVVSFSKTLGQFSILYSPQELGCDDSATMRVTAYKNGAFVGSDTMTAPVPGTWPSATLSIAAPSGFNSVVVHYDAPPPTCQDWGSIFMADNLIATLIAIPCPADTTGDSVVNVSDLLMVINNWGPNGGPADINSDGVVNVGDLLAVINAWGACP